MKDKQIALKWSKKEKDWIFDYPDNSGARMAGHFFQFIKEVDGIGLEKFLTNRGYDHTTFKITCKKI